MSFGRSTLFVAAVTASWEEAEDGEENAVEGGIEDDDCIGRMTFQ